LLCNQSEMKKIDKLFIKSFIGPFILTTAVVVFIFLMRFLMMYFSDFIGKNLGLDVFAKLFSYFSLITVPTALPLATLLATLMTFGNLGEHTELTAIKSAGIPFSRIILPTLIFTVFISIFSYFYNDRVTPWANLKGYSLLWDVKTTKLTLNIQEGIFYKEIPGYRIKVQKKFANNRTLKNIIVYDHQSSSGNKSVTMADSGEMYTQYNNNYLVFELFNGKNYMENNGVGNNAFSETQFTKNYFKKNKMVFSLESFGIKRTNEDQFKYHEYMKNSKELSVKIDSLTKEIKKNKIEQTSILKNQNTYIFRQQFKTEQVKIAKIKAGPWIKSSVDKFKDGYRKIELDQYTQGRLQSLKSQLETDININTAKLKDVWRADIERWHKITMAFSCLVMFLIGASIGSIIKKGGFGMPVLVSISFFIFYYVLMQLGDKYAKEGIIPVLVGVWMPCTVLLIIGIYMARKASNDENLFENNPLDKIKPIIEYISKRKSKSASSLV
jgi:lipopolysaccharide export system permease protein